MKFVIYVVQDGYLDGSMNREYFTLVHCKFHYEQDLGISIKLHLGLIPWPLSLPLVPYPLILLIPRKFRLGALVVLTVCVCVISKFFSNIVRRPVTSYDAT